MNDDKILPVKLLNLFSQIRIFFLEYHFRMNTTHYHKKTKICDFLNFHICLAIYDCPPQVKGLQGTLVKFQCALFQDFPNYFLAHTFREIVRSQPSSN